ncbi:hypothetical protein [Cohnella sp. GbtcB17]|uniref:hypothetical protein n=1 Tax=Cohnella sp. GbtcB17 TaxID=2824762 RepID=UPI001C306CE9|nr:hypothetical protein [Cohnella sp. GbtcB17]
MNSLKFFLDNGKYLAKIEASKQLDILRNLIKQFQVENNLRKFYWRTEGVAGYFESIRIFEEDKEALKDYLMQVGVLPVVVDVKWRNIVESDQKLLQNRILPQCPILRFTPNNNMQDSIDRIIEYNEKAKKLNLSEQLTEWKAAKNKFALLQFEWETIRKQLQHKLIPGEKIKLDQGTISSLIQDPFISGESLHKLLGSNAVEKYGTVNHSKLMIFMSRGMVKKSELNIYRRIVDIRLRYVLKVIKKRTLSTDMSS